MQKKTQYSDKYGKVIDVGEVPEKRGTPGVTMLEGVYEVPERTGSAPWTAAPKAEKAEAKAEAKVEKKAEKAEKKVEKAEKADDSE